VIVRHNRFREVPGLKKKNDRVKTALSDSAQPNHKHRGGDFTLIYKVTVCSQSIESNTYLCYRGFPGVGTNTEVSGVPSVEGVCEGEVSAHATQLARSEYNREFGNANSSCEKVHPLYC